MNAPTDAEIAAAALASAPMGSRAALHRLWERCGDPHAALDAVRHNDAGEEWRGAGALVDIDRVARIMTRRGTRVLLPHDADWPLPADCPEPPAILFAEGDAFEALLRPAVSIVGTRAATPNGEADAHDLAAHVVRAGYTVVSGLAIGIDAAAHRGALDGGGCTIGVVATGLDVVYPRRHVDLFAKVRAHGVVLGEYPFGTPPERWRFPSRNRLIAALGEACVVVEAKAQGGALSTAGHAMQIGRALLAMPGSRRNAAAAGTNELIRDGAQPLLEPRDLFVALGLRAASGATAPGDGDGCFTRPAAVALSHDATEVVRACHGEPATIDQLLGRTGLSTAAVSAALRELERVGAVSRRSGRIWPA
ncbi:MAG TPA: DNA-processing protein DprA [Acidimicrobiia bacterium]